MNTTIKRLQSIRVADLMNREVVTISANSTMAEAAEVLSSSNITGAPVVDEHGQCVGILSTTDFARGTLADSKSGPLSASADEYELVRDAGSGPFQIEHVAGNLVCQHMNNAPQSIGSEQSLIDAARYMQCAHIHRLIVVDQHAHPVGVISSLDLIAALTNVVDEQTSESFL